MRRTVAPPRRWSRAGRRRAAATAPHGKVDRGNSAPGKIAIAVVTFNRSTYLKELLASAAAMDTPPFKIVVVDNASTDDTQQVLATAMKDFPDGLVINHRLDTNTGGSGGFSEGTKVALEQGADWVWL